MNIKYKSNFENKSNKWLWEVNISKHVGDKNKYEW